MNSQVHPQFQVAWGFRERDRIINLPDGLDWIDVSETVSGPEYPANWPSAS